jgi:hypothetical protein
MKIIKVQALRGQIFRTQRKINQMRLVGNGTISTNKIEGFKEKAKKQCFLQ